MLDSVASKGNDVVKSHGSHNSLIPAAGVVSTAPNIILYGSNLLYNVSQSCQNDKTSKAWDLFAQNWQKSMF